MDKTANATTAKWQILPPLLSNLAKAHRDLYREQVAAWCCRVGLRLKPKQ